MTSPQEFTIWLTWAQPQFGRNRDSAQFALDSLNPTTAMPRADFSDASRPAKSSLKALSMYSFSKSAGNTLNTAVND